MKLILLIVILSLLFVVDSFKINQWAGRVNVMKCRMSDVETAQVFLGNIPFDIEEDALTSLVKEKSSRPFQALKLIKKKETGKSRGFAYLTYNTKAEAEEAITELKSIEVNGRNLKVEFSVPTSSSDRTTRPPRPSSEFKLFVGNVDFRATEADITDAANNILGSGVVKRVDIILDKETRKPRGFGYLHFATKEDMESSKSKLAGMTLLGRELRVDDVSPRSPAEKRPFGSFERRDGPRDSSQRPNKPRSEHSIYIGNLAWEVNDKIIGEMLADVVGPGLVSNIRMAMDRETGRSRGFCHVDFINAESMERALVELEGMSIYDRVLKIDKATVKERKFGEGDGLNQRKPRGDRYESSVGEEQSSYSAW